MTTVGTQGDVNVPDMLNSATLKVKKNESIWDLIAQVLHQKWLCYDNA